MSPNLKETRAHLVSDSLEAVASTIPGSCQVGCSSGSRSHAPSGGILVRVHSCLCESLVFGDISVHGLDRMDKLKVQQLEQACFSRNRIRHLWQAVGREAKASIAIDVSTMGE